MRMEITDFRFCTLSSELLCACVRIVEGGRIIHAYPLFVPPLEFTYTRDQCARRAASYLAHGQSVVMQMYMSTSRGLNA